MNKAARREPGGLEQLKSRFPRLGLAGQELYWICPVDLPQ